MSVMIRLCRFVILLVVLVACTRESANSQTSNSQWPDSPSHTREAYGESSDSPSNREVSWRSLPKDFLHDQKGIWLLFPAQLAKGHYWLPTLAIAAGTAGLIVADPHAMPYFRSHARNLDDVNDTFDAPITSAEVIALPAALLVAGYARHDSYQVGTQGGVVPRHHRHRHDARHPARPDRPVGAVGGDDRRDDGLRGGIVRADRCCHCRCRSASSAAWRSASSTASASPISAYRR